MKIRPAEVIHERFTFDTLINKNDVMEDFNGFDVTVSVYKRIETNEISTLFELWDSISKEYVRSFYTLKEAIDWILI